MKIASQPPLRRCGFRSIGSGRGAVGESSREPLRDFGFRAVRGDRQKVPGKRFFNACLTTH
jgi:hypothetical protein